MSPSRRGTAEEGRMAVVLEPEDTIVRRGDSLERYTVVLRDAQGVPLPIPPDATPRLLMGRQRDEFAWIDAPMTIDDAAAGVVGYDWQPGDTDLPGIFRAFAVVTYADGSQRTFPYSGAF